MSAIQKALFIRLDKIGDLILTLPADEHPLLKDTQKTWFISKGLGFIPAHASPSRKYVEWTAAFSWAQFFELVQAVRELAPDVSVTFQSPWWVTLAVWWAGVPRRIGVLSKWHSFVFLNHGLRQKRSDCRLHELDYNHELVHKGLKATGTVPSNHLRLLAPAVPLDLPPLYFVVHPGMAGSARNWSVQAYADLIRRLLPDRPVVITGTAGDRHIVEPLRVALADESRVIWKNELLTAPQLLATLANAEGVFAPSTGVIHMAASLGRPTYGVYSPVTVQRTQRWGPRGDQVRTWTPHVDCPGHFRCLGEACPHYDCMKLVSAQEIVNNIPRNP